MEGKIEVERGVLRNKAVMTHEQAERYDEVIVENYRKRRDDFARNEAYKVLSSHPSASSPSSSSVRSHAEQHNHPDSAQPDLDYQQIVKPVRSNSAALHTIIRPQAR